MKYTLAALILIVPMALAVPSPQAPPDAGIIDGGIRPEDGNGPADRKVKRFASGGWALKDYGIAPLSEHPSANVSNLEVRNNCGNCISTCGDHWVYNNAHQIGDFTYNGFNAAIDKFCSHATTWFPGGQTVIVPPKSYYTVSVIGTVAMSHGNTPAIVDFEIHNKQHSAEHTVNLADCTTFLKALTDPNGKCYGKKNDDTKGGTWQLHDKTVSYHGLNRSP